jgi:hypothetical protein
VVWIFAEHSDFATLEREAGELERGGPVRRALLPGLRHYLSASGAGFAESGWLRAQNAAGQALERLSLRAEARPASNGMERHRGVVEVARQRIAVDALLLGRPAAFETSQPLLGDVLARLAALARRGGFGISVVYVPSRFRLFDGLWLRPPPRTPRLPDGAALVAEECAARGIPFRDATPELRALLAAGVLPINPIHDQHLNAAGMRAVAGLIAELVGPATRTR